MRPIIHSKKHYVQVSLDPIAAGAVEQKEIISAVQEVDLNALFEVIEGATIKAVFVEMWWRSQTTAAGSAVATIEKLGLDANGPTTTEMAALGAYNNKKNVFYTTQGLINDDNVAIPFIRQWIKIPKSKQRFGLGDSLVMNIFAQGAIAMEICGFFTYKEYT